VFNPSISASTNRINLDQDGDSVNDYAFDAAGNTTNDAQMRKFTYDAENKQTKVETVNSSGTVTGTIGEYFYDGDGRRVKKRGWINGQWEETIFVYVASSRLVAEYSTNLSQTPQVAYLTNDHLGSPRINTDENGAVISRHDYRPYGEEVTERTHSQYAADTIRKQFTGYERDNETELDFAQARYFNSGFGRFSSPDPYNMIFEKEKGRCKVAKRMIFLRFIVQPQNWNRYIYVVNNPTNLTDPTGLIYLRKDGITYYIPDATYNQNLEKDENFYKDYAVVPYGSIVRVGDGATGIFEPFIGQSVVLLPNGKLRPINDIGDFSVDVNISGEPLEQIEPIWGNRDVGINLLNDPMQDGWRAESRNFPRGDPSGSVDPYNGGYRHCVSACLLFKRGGLIGHLGRKIWDWRNETSETAESRGDMRAEDIGEHLAKYSCGLCTCESECLQAFPAP